MEFAVIIPARYKSTRLPGKPLVEILGKSLVRRVWEKCVEAVGPKCVYIATDDSRISQHCEEHGMQCILTPESCLTGTDRIWEASKVLETQLLINVQGDEPLLDPADITKVIEEAIQNPDTVICGMCEITDEKDFRSPTVPKVVCDQNNFLLYMSRAAIPTSKALTFEKAYKQVCIYGLPKHKLEIFGKHQAKTPIESIEDIELLRFIEMGHRIKMVEVSSSSVAVDVPEDVARVEGILSCEQ
ncbi:MAG: 3-deoxy-manno-octulosonate cytidylyltransferase [Bdellovibrionales bacterium]|nr:3-deoxy-manno-octulosonate cytidylyltransferase [Bdellovibrionales bacterium]